MKRTNSRWQQLLELISPRQCAICGSRLSLGEDFICSTCNLRLPRTGYAADATRNEMAQLFWARIPIERAAALMFYQPQAQTGRFVYDLKYRRQPQIGQQAGRMMSQEMAPDGFFDGIDCIVPVPLTRGRERQRGYNQSLMIAQGINQVTGIPINTHALRRTAFGGSQTQMNAWQRQENVEGAFELADAASVCGRHVLLVDDIVTTGATMVACGKVLAVSGGVKISILSIGYTKT